MRGQKPALRKTSWQVYTTDQIYRVDMDGPVWCWVAHGPFGSDSGVEHRAQDAIQKAYAATVLLDDPQVRA